VVTFRKNKLIFKEGNKEKAKDLLRNNNITPEDVKDWFKAEYDNPCCLEPQLELRLLDDLRIAFFCENCQSWRFKERLNNIKQKDNLTREEKQQNRKPTYNEIINPKGISLNRRCVNCEKDNWRIAKPNSVISAIECVNCKHAELYIFGKRRK